MEIRQISYDELEQLLEFYQHLHAEDDPLPEAEQIEDVWKEVQSNPRLVHLGAYDSDQLTASCTLTIIPNLTRACRPYGLIENVVTHPDFRRRGMGKAILSNALDYAWKADCYKVMLMTGRKDEGTYAFYESAGFDRHAKQAFLAKAPASK